MADLWTRETVWAREIEAQDTICRLPRERLAVLKAAWPVIKREFADAVHAEETRIEEGYPWAASWSRPAPPEARAIDRMTEVWSWHTLFLASEPHHVRVLQGMALAAACHQPLLRGVAFLKRRRWTAYRVKDRALDTIASGLNKSVHKPSLVAA